MSGRRFLFSGRVGRLGAALAAMCGTLVLTSAFVGDGESPAAAASGCGVTLGEVTDQINPNVFSIQTAPAVAGQGCNTTISVSAVLLNSAGRAIASAPSQSVPLTFLPNQPPPQINWFFSICKGTPQVRFVASSPTAGSASVTVPSSGDYYPCGLMQANAYFADPSSVVGIAPVAGAPYYVTVPRNGTSLMTLGIHPTVGISAAPGGVWQVASDGGVFSVMVSSQAPGMTVPFYGSMGGKPLNAPVVGIASTADHGGYWLVGTDGGVFSFGDAGFYGSIPGALAPGQSLTQPIVGIASTPDGKGYWIVASDGGIFAFGDAPFWGSMGGKPLNRPIVGMAGNGVGGYWLVASDGGVFSFNADFLGSMASVALNAPISGVAATPDGKGFWMVARDRGVFAFGDAPFSSGAP